ncbi:ABC transporter substrate-binding protein [Amycolatopsis sp. NPDC051372]|uniref:ABC transporter substrate-binding protein n=1 Tax=Amycolatopsis sp. NPDC051372 TaxID=3155669 RepID=UPI00342C793F
MKGKPPARPDIGLSRRSFLSVSLAAAGLVLVSCTKAADLGSGSGSDLTVGIPTDIVPANLLRQVAANFPVRALMFDTLVNLDRTSGEPKPSVATSWAWNEARTQLTVKLRDDVVFHTGRAFTAKDVAFAVQAIKAPASGSQFAPIAKKLKAVRADTAHQVTFVLGEPTSTLFDLLALMPLVDSETFKDLPSGRRVVGTGPFAWGKWTPGISLALSRNTRYWQPSKPPLDTLTLQVYKQSQAMLAGLQAGQLPLAYALAPRDAAVLARDGKFRIETSSPQFTDWYVGVNVKSAPFTDVRARLAVAHSLDRVRIADQVFSGYGTATSLPFSDTAPGLSKADNTALAYNPAKAQQLFVQAGSPKTPITLAADAGYPTTMAILNIVQYGLESVGFTVNPQPLDTGTLQSQLQAASIKGLWIGAMDLNCVSIGTACLGGAPLKAAKNTSNVTDPRYAHLVNAVVDAGDDTALAGATRALVDYLNQEAFHLTVAHGLYVTATQGVSGVDSDVSKNLVLTSTKRGNA